MQSTVFPFIRPIPKPSNNWLEVYREKGQMFLPSRSLKMIRRANLKNDIEKAERELAEVRADDSPAGVVKEKYDALNALKAQLQSLSE